MAKWTYTRIRKRGEPDWLDPNTDIRKLFPVVMLQAIDTIELSFPEDSQEYKDALYIQNCIHILQIRVLEDPASITDQVLMFMNAIQKVSPSVRVMWMRYVVFGLVTVYGLFCRRDSVTDKEALLNMRDYMTATMLEDVLSPNTMFKVKQEMWQRIATVQRSIDPDASVLCNETGEYIDNVKEIAAKAVGVVGGADWNSMAEACDTAFSTRSIKSDVEGIAVALAYPTYEQPTLTVSLNESGTEDKEPAAEGEPGAV